jgi:hypothetical protein
VNNPRPFRHSVLAQYKIKNLNIVFGESANPRTSGKNPRGFLKGLAVPDGQLAVWNGQTGEKPPLSFCVVLFGFHGVPEVV